MVMAVEKKKSIIEAFQGKKADTGSPAVQVALLTERINYLTEHLNLHKKDHHSRYGLIKLVSQRKKLLEYLKKTQSEKYKEVIAKLGLRK
jgi:small subunit ribosomal protein S15